MKITIRMDDITPDMDWAKFNRFLALMEQYGVKALLGIVPRSRDELLHITAEDKEEEFWNLVRQLEQQGHILAMHGCYHVYTTKKGGLFPLNHLSEFAGVSQKEQNAMIGEGRRLLDAHGIHPRIFMAPAHSYDRNTLKALCAHGFTAVTDGFGSAPYHQWGLDFYPISFNRSGSLKSGAAEAMTTFVVHVNTMTQEEYAFYEEVFRSGKVAAYSEWMNAAARPRGFAGHLCEYVLATAKRLLVALRA